MWQVYGVYGTADAANEKCAVLQNQGYVAFVHEVEQGDFIVYIEG
jgi:cell division septation protein DedD